METKNKELRISSLRLSLFDMKGERSSSFSESSGSSVASRGLSSSPESDLNLGLDLDNEKSEGVDVGVDGDQTLDSTQRGERKTVSFGNVSCRFYHRTAGLHPAVSSGPALDFSWEYRVAQDISLEEYEAFRPIEQRRNRSQMIMSRLHREMILQRDCGMPKTKIAAIVRKINHTKAQRRQTLNNLKLGKVQEKWQKCTRGIKRILFIRKSYEEELKLLWLNAKKANASIERSLGSTSSSTNTEISTEAQFSSLSSLSALSLCCQRKDRKQRRSSELDKARPRMYFDLVPSGRSNNTNEVTSKNRKPSEDRTLATDTIPSDFELTESLELGRPDRLPDPDQPCRTQVSGAHENDCSGDICELDRARHHIRFELDGPRHKVTICQTESDVGEHQDSSTSELDRVHHTINFKDPKQESIPDSDTDTDHKYRVKEENQNDKPFVLEEDHQDKNKSYLDKCHHTELDQKSDRHILDQTRHGVKYALGNDDPFLARSINVPDEIVGYDKSIPLEQLHQPQGSIKYDLGSTDPFIEESNIATTAIITANEDAKVIV